MKKEIKIFGERNTGTNYLLKVLELNFKVKVIKGVVSPRFNRFIKHLPKQERLKDIYFNIYKYHNLGWKHKQLEFGSRCIKNLERRQDLVFIAIIKNPYSWLLSLYKKPYHNKAVETLEFEDFLKKPWDTVKRENSTSEYSNPIVMWNKKNRSYLRLKDYFESTYILRYEDILMKPMKEIESLKNVLNLKQKSNTIKNFHDSTKSSTKNNDFYKDYYGNEKWKSMLTKNMLT